MNPHHPMYGTTAYRMMLAANARSGFKTVFMGPGIELSWIRVPMPGCMCPGHSSGICPVHARGLSNIRRAYSASLPLDDFRRFYPQ